MRASSSLPRRRVAARCRGLDEVGESRRVRHSGTGRRRDRGRGRATICGDEFAECRVAGQFAETPTRSVAVRMTRSAPRGRQIGLVGDENQHRCIQEHSSRSSQDRLRIGRVHHPQHQIGFRQCSLRPLDALGLQTLGVAQAGGVDQFDRPAVERDPHADRVARRARDLRHDRPLIPREGVDERTLPDVRRPRDDDLPRLDEMPPDGRERGEFARVRQRPPGVRVEQPEDARDGPVERAVQLIEQDGRGAERRGALEQTASTPDALRSVGLLTRLHGDSEHRRTARPPTARRAARRGSEFRRASVAQ